jgi:hypothetical protein
VDNKRNDVKEEGRDVVDCVDLDLNEKGFLTFNLRFPLITGNFLTAKRLLVSQEIHAP